MEERIISVNNKLKRNISKSYAKHKNREINGGFENDRVSFE
jgi:hypothetical protein